MKGIHYLKKSAVTLPLLALGLAAVLQSGCTSWFGEGGQHLSAEDYRDKLKGGWVGQMIGVAWGASTEFEARERVLPSDRMPIWHAEMINECFNQDDLYVEMTFLRSMEVHGIDVSIRQAGIDFANSKYELWCANLRGRDNLREGIAPPDSSYPSFNNCPNDIDYQIEADYSGLIAPGMPQEAVTLGEKFGRLMNYGDGLYAGQFVGAMYAAAYFETNVRHMVESALKAIPAESQYAEMVRDLLKWSEEEPDNWRKTWRLIRAKYRNDPAYSKDSNGAIDARINGAIVLLGLLYGRGDIENTSIISMRGGYDSDCNPSTACGVLCTMLGYSRIPGRFKELLKQNEKFAYTDYTFPELLAVCEKLTHQLIVRNGGKIKQDGNGEDYFIIPERSVTPSPYEPSWLAAKRDKPERYTAEEQAMIKEPRSKPGKWVPRVQAEDLIGKRVVFLGDDITQLSNYVPLTAYYLQRGYTEESFDILNLAVADETLTGESEFSFARWKGWERPCLFTRLDKVLEYAKPKIVFAAYGMNDALAQDAVVKGGSPTNALPAFTNAVMNLVNKCKAAGVEHVILLTPPLYDAQSALAGNATNVFDYSPILEIYDQWEKQLREDMSPIKVILVRRDLKKLVEKNPDMAYSNDGVRPNEEAQLTIARAILNHLNLRRDDTLTAEQVTDDKLYQLVEKQCEARSAAWLTYLEAPMASGAAEELMQAENEAKRLQKQIDAIRQVED